jgi:hypothetical protein
MKVRYESGRNERVNDWRQETENPKEYSYLLLLISIIDYTYKCHGVPQMARR